ncbi:hypothetical protein ACFPIF_02530 [Brevundimonas faecalis]|uniref:AbiTii domain-containing protein n=1 Tax=Brevundimonas faecalis TaxID=947378 RepID=UPI00361194B7
MSSLVEELQRDALDPNTSIPVLLRKVKLVAAKLRLEGTGEWVDAELNGYSRETPDYRIKRGDVRWWNPYRGWLPVQGADMIMSKLSEKRVGESVSALEALAASTDDNFHIPVSHDIAAQILKIEFLGTPKVAVFFNKNVFTDILDQVRTRVLDWALELEKAGIMGEGVSFSPVEKERAANVNITVGTMSGNLMAGDVSGPNARANMGSTDNSSNNIGDTLTQLSKAIEAGVENEADRQAMLETVRDMQRAKGKGAFASSYQKLIATAADHMTVLTPFLPALAKAMAGAG